METIGKGQEGSSKTPEHRDRKNRKKRGGPVVEDGTSFQKRCTFKVRECCLQVELPWVGLRMNRGHVLCEHSRRGNWSVRSPEVRAQRSLEGHRQKHDFWGRPVSVEGKVHSAWWPWPEETCEVLRDSIGENARSFHLVIFTFLCIRVTPVNTIIQVSGTQFCNTPHVHCIVYSAPQVKSPCPTIYPPAPASPSPTPTPTPRRLPPCHSAQREYFFSVFLSPPAVPPTSPTPHSCQPARSLSLYESVPTLLVSYFCSLDST